MPIYRALYATSPQLMNVLDACLLYLSSLDDPPPGLVTIFSGCDRRLCTLTPFGLAPTSNVENLAQILLFDSAGPHRVPTPVPERSARQLTPPSPSDAYPSQILAVATRPGTAPIFALGAQRSSIASFQTVIALGT